MGICIEYDLALLKVYDINEFPYINIGNSQKLKPAETVYAIGNPEGFEQMVTQGIFSRIKDNWIQSNVMINPGNSGGPLITKDGKVVGINTSAMKAKISGQYSFSISIGTAIKEFNHYLGYLTVNEN